MFFVDALCIENISTIDPEIGLLENQTIIIKAGKIIQISPSQDLQLVKENTIIDGTGKYMIPGLWDAHIHFSFIKEMAPNMLDLFLAYGITSVRDTGGDINFVNTWKEISLANPTDAPRVMVAGPLLDGNPNVYEVLEVLKKNDTWQIPTLTLNTAFARRPFAAKDWQKSFSYLPKNIKEQWLNYINNLVKSEVKPFDEKYAKWMFNMTKRVHNKGIKIMAGTDTPIFFLTPGLSLHEELAVLVEAGLSPLEALKSATTNPAAYFNLEKELGKIAINNWADLVILDANPLEDINNTKQINAVIKQGKYFNREHLDGLLTNLTTKK